MIPVRFLRNKALGLGLCLLSIACLPLPAVAEDLRTLKAALSYNFAKFTKWPTDAQPEDSWKICYFGEEFTAGFKALNNKKLNAKPIEIKRLRGVEQAMNCHGVFIDSKNRGLLQRLFISLQNSPTLTISDSAGFIEQGGMIEIVSSEQRLKFKVNQVAINRVKLSISSQVLKLALDVKQ